MTESTKGYPNSPLHTITSKQPISTDGRPQLPDQVKISMISSAILDFVWTGEVCAELVPSLNSKSHPRWRAKWKVVRNDTRRSTFLERGRWVVTKYCWSFDGLLFYQSEMCFCCLVRHSWQGRGPRNTQNRCSEESEFTHFEVFVAFSLVCLSLMGICILCR